MQIIFKVVVLLMLLASFSVQSITISENNKAFFDIVRKKKIIGSHEIEFVENDENLIITTNINSQPPMLTRSPNRVQKLSGAQLAAVGMLPPVCCEEGWITRSATTLVTEAVAAPARRGAVTPELKADVTDATPKLVAPTNPAFFRLVHPTITSGKPA